MYSLTNNHKLLEHSLLSMKAKGQCKKKKKSEQAEIQA